MCRLAGSRGPGSVFYTGIGHREPYVSKNFSITEKLKGLSAAGERKEKGKRKVLTRRIKAVLSGAHQYLVGKTGFVVVRKSQLAGG